MLPSHWPYPLKPRSQELLSSWLIRNSFYTGVNPYRFCERLLPNIPIWDRDIDRYLPHKIVEKLSGMSGISCTEVRAMTLDVARINTDSNWSGIAAITPMVLSLGMHGRKRLHFGLQYCPYCLTEEPYFRKSWRYAFNTHCNRHGCQLLDACVSCGEKVMPHRAERIDLCWKCRQSLSSNKVNRIDPLPPPEIGGFLGSRTDSIGRYLSLEVSDITPLQNLRSLMKVVVEVDREGLVNILEEKKLHFELLRVDARKEIIKKLEEVIVAWPDSFHAYMRKNNVTQRKFSRSRFDGFIGREIDKLPVGKRVRRVYKPVVYNQELKNLRRRALNKYRIDRSNLLLKDCVNK